MSSPRETILGNVRNAMRRSGLPNEEPAAIEKHLAHPTANIIPARGRPQGRQRIEGFVAEAERVSATIAPVAGVAEVPGAVVAYLGENDLPMTVRMAADVAGGDIPWSAAPALEIVTGAADPPDMVGITGAFAAIAETGTLMLLSGPDSPTTLNFLPDTHIVVLSAPAVVGSHEEAWARLRAATDGRMPRAVNWITGPSRTADIEQTLMLGVHAPRRLHIVLIDDQET
jgi:L-lactate dehydrogenase complex protein LldG